MRRRASFARAARGVSLVEALVALAVMAFGILGVVGVQLTLRATGDLSKQRAEAVRIAQSTLETARSYAYVASAPAGEPSYEDLIDQAATPVVGPATNTTYSVEIEVVDDFNPLFPSTPRRKSVEVAVTWPDRTGAEQAVVLRSMVSGVPPELAGSLTVPAFRAPGERSRAGRSPLIPRTAVDVGGGRSVFEPPGGGTVAWVFSNVSGEIVQFCNPWPNCTDASAFLLSGFVRFATGSAPTAAMAETPPSPALPVDVVVNTTLPTIASYSCFEALDAGYVAYYCAVPVPATPPRRWSGRSILSGLALATSVSDATATRWRVCRYTPVRNHLPPGGNVDHPLDYVNVTESLANQNFLVIGAGDGGTAYDCPPDDAATPLVNGNTWHHQPSS